MAEKLMHLPTKPAMIQAEGKVPFVRRQHYQPNEEMPKGEGSGGEQGVGKESRSRIPSQLIKPILGSEKGNALQPVENAPGRGLMPEREKVGGFGLNPVSDQLGGAERVMTSTLPEKISDQHKLEKVGQRTMNGVYTFTGEDGKSRYFQKPRQEEGIGFKKQLEDPLMQAIEHALGGKGVICETIPENFAGREVASYEMSKMLGVEGLVPPTQSYSHQMEFGQDGLYDGPVQMSVHDFGKNHLRHDGVHTVTDTLKQNEEDDQRGIMERANNASDMVAFDFITGNIDRHGGNYFVGEKKNGEYQLIANDNGMTFPNHEGDMMHPDWGNSFETQHDYFHSSASERPISDNFLSGILSFNEGVFHEMGAKNGISKTARDAAVYRVKKIQEHVRGKYMEAIEKYADREWTSREERNAVLKKEVTFSGKDLEKIIRSDIMTNKRENGTEKYTKSTLGSGNQNARDWTNQIKQMFKER